MANYWAARGRRITVLTFDRETASSYPLDKRIRVEALGLIFPSKNIRESLAHTVRRHQRLKKALEETRPDVVLSFTELANIRCAAAARHAGIPCVISERTDPRFHHVGRMWNMLRRLTYPLANALIVQNNSVKEYFGKLINSTVVSMPNPVAPAEPDATIPPGLPAPYVVCVARLSREKGLRLLLDAFATFATSCPDWSLVLVGDGPLLGELEEQARALGLTDKVVFAGRQAHVAGFLLGAELFVLPSRYEGFPNALCEAMAHGLACISTQTAGSREIITHGKDGILVGQRTPESLSRAMTSLAKDAQLRRKLGDRARLVADRHSEETVMKQWDSLLEKIAMHADVS